MKQIQGRGLAQKLDGFAHGLPMASLRHLVCSGLVYSLQSAFVFAFVYAKKKLAFSLGDKSHPEQ